MDALNASFNQLTFTHQDHSLCTALDQLQITDQDEPLTHLIIHDKTTTLAHTKLSSQLQYLEINDCTHITDDNFNRATEHCHSLKKIAAYRTQLSLSTFKPSQALEMLCISGSQNISGRTLLRIAETCPNLSIIEATGINLDSETHKLLEARDICVYV